MLSFSHDSIRRSERQKTARPFRQNSTIIPHLKRDCFAAKTVPYMISFYILRTLPRSTKSVHTCIFVLILL